MMNRGLMLQSAEQARSMDDDRALICYSIPDTKLKNVFCIICQRKFYIPDVAILKGLLTRKAQIPLLLNCGHSICNKCVKSHNVTNCHLCNKRIASEIHDKQGQTNLLPLNLYALGLIVSSYYRPLPNEDEDFTFCHRSSKQLRQIAKQGFCHECGKQSNVRCLQCNVLFCYFCYSKIHGRALQSHKYVLLLEGGPDSPANILNNCSPNCFEALNYFCNECNVALCSNCTLNLHKLHDFVSLAEKNETLLPEFDQICEEIEETLLRTGQAREKIRSVLMSNNYKLQNSEDIEALITTHFAYLHGVLQNMEAKLLNDLYRQDNKLKNDLEDMEVQLRSQEESLQITMQTASYAKQIFHKVDIQNAIRILKQSADFPCYLMYKDIGQRDTAMFTIDNSIIAALENHCTIHVPSISSYHLSRKDELPKNYIISPLKPRSITKTNPSRQLALLAPDKPDESNTASTSSTKSEDKENQESTSKYNVEITYIVNASWFYVRKLATKPKFIQFEKDLIEYENNRQDVTQPMNIRKNDICIVKQSADKCYRGFVNAIKTAQDGCRLYNIFYLDYGHENYVSASWLRDVPDHLRDLPPQAIRCSLHGVMPKNDQWTNASTSDFIKLTSETDCSISMIIFKSLRDKLYVDLCVTTTKDINMGPQSICNAMIDMDHARTKTLYLMHSMKHKKEHNRELFPLYKHTRVVVEYFVSPDKIYVSKFTNKEKFTKMKEDLNKYYITYSAEKIDMPRPGMMCVAQLSNSWQRAEIVEVMNEDEVIVFFVDCGYSLTVNRNELREILHHYASYKKQAIRMSLIMPEFDENCKSEVCSELQNIFYEKEYIYAMPRKVIIDGYHGCMFVDDIKKNVIQQLKTVNEFSYNTFEKKAIKESQSPVMSSSNSTKSEQSSSSVKGSYAAFNNAENDKSIEKDEITKDPFKVEVLIKRMVTPYCIYVAQKEYEESNIVFISEMQKFYNTYHCPTKNNWCEDALCAVYSAKDKKYFRAKILDINSSTEVLVYFYDMGIEETVTLKDIQILNPKFVKKPAHYFKVKLAGILPCGGSSTWPSLSCETLNDIIQDNMNCTFYITKLVQEEICDDVIPIELWIRQTRIPGPFSPAEIEINSINRMLVDKGVALPVRNYFSKADSVLATELKRQLINNREFLLTEEDEREIKWLKKALHSVDCKELNDTMSHKRDSSSCNNDALIDLTTKCQHSTMTDCNRPIKFTNWLPPIEIKEQEFDATTTYVDNDCAVYLYPKKYDDTLNSIKTELQTHCKPIKIKECKQWNKGDICIAQYHVDKNWYRGRIFQNMGNVLQVEFVDYGNIEECEMQYVTDDIKLAHIPIQCTKCIISGLKPRIGKWELYDLDRIHALLVGRNCKVTTLQKESTHLIISLTLLHPWKQDLLVYLINHMDMNIKIERKESNENFSNDDLRSNSSADVIIEKIIDNETVNVVNTLKESLSELHIESTTLNENVLSGNLAESMISEFNDDKETCDFKNISWMDAISLDKEIVDTQLACSTPQRQLDEDNFFGVYKRLKIPQETKYIEIMLCCNKDPIISYAQLAKNEGAIFPDMFRKYYLQYEKIMENLQVHASSQPLIQSFEKNTPCITKFSDDIWYRCIITHGDKIPSTQCIQVSLHYVDYGNNVIKMLDVLSDHGLHVPKEEWLELPAMAIKCTFWGLKFVDNNVDLLATKLDEVYNQAAVARIMKIDNESDLVVEVYKDKTCEELLYMQLIQEGLYQLKTSQEKED